MQHAIYDTHAPKRPTNLSVNADLLQQARECNINLSATLEAALVLALREKQRAQWLEENRDAIDAYNQDVDAKGVFSDGLRSF
ncbi:type II toxin-antitoxin system CcdA family antitoxin [Burkholderiaceae bacterium DAT-1]|nr:type II toxin-antitoxin system CcdA family antitoxin [Burkholderiaceae bacterium DAT-1]